MAINKSRKEVLGLRVIRDGKVLKELDLEDRLTIGGAHTDHVITAGDKKSAVLFRTAKNGEAELLLAENYRGEIGGDGEMLSFGHLKTLGLLKREGNSYVVPIQRGRSGFVQADGVTFEFSYRPPLPGKKITIPKQGPGYAALGTWVDPDNVPYYRVLAVVGAVLIAFMVGAQYAHIEEREFVIEDIFGDIAKIEMPDIMDIGDLAEGEGEGVGVGPGGGAGGAGSIGAGIPATGVVAAITTLGGSGSGKYLADLLGAGGSGGDLDGIAARLGGLRGTYGGGGVGGALGPGSGDGTGLGGGVDLLSGLGGGYGGRGPHGGKLRKKSVSVEGAVSSIAGPGRGEAQRSPQVIASVIRRHLAGIQNAYNSALKKNPNLGSGKITIRFTILAGGSVGTVSIVQDTLSSPVLSSAILVRVRGWRFPKVEAGSVTVVYPFVFVASEV
jgi:hypothetical protein